MGIGAEMSAAPNGRTTPPANRERPLVSVAIPMYNAETHVGECLDSLLAQTLGDIEIIAVNDASTDRTVEIVAGYAERDSRVRLFHNEKNMNSFATRVAALERARGEYVFCCDSDDLAPPDAFARLVAEAKRTGADIVHGRTLLLEKGVARETAYFVEPFRASTGREFLLDILLCSRGWNVWGKLFARRVVEKALPPLSCGLNLWTLDDLLTTGLFALGADGYATLEHPVYHYRVPPVTHIDRAGGLQKWAADSIDVVMLLEERVACVEPEGALRQGVRRFMQYCILRVEANTPRTAEVYARMGKTLRDKLDSGYVAWMDERGLFGAGPPADEPGGVKKLARRLRSAAKRVFELGLRESYIALRLRLLFARWERQYEAARAAAGKNDSCSQKLG